MVEVVVSEELIDLRTGLCLLEGKDRFSFF